MKTKNKIIAALKIWVVIYPSITLFHYLWGARLTLLPLYLRTLLLTLSLVPFMVFVGMPLLEKLIAMLIGKNKTD
jgi:antibiotic biosynthesis monooxygenase (ABM) superfamily enzyme